MKKKVFIYITLTFIFSIIIWKLIVPVSGYRGKNSSEPDSNIIDVIEISSDTIRSKLNDIAGNIASPVEIAAFIKKLDIPFSMKYLLKSETDHYNRDIEQAIALGGFGVDLMYINFFGKNRQMLVPLDNIRKITQNLYISQFFDFEQLKDLSTDNLTSEKLQSIKRISTFNLNRMEEYLLGNKRAELGVFMILGAWTEGIYILTQVAKDYPGEEIYERVAEQKFFIEELWKILYIFKEYNDIRLVMNEMNALKKELTKIDFKYENLGKPWKTIDIDGNVAYYQWQKSIAQIDKSMINNIVVKTEKFRNDLFTLQIFKYRWL